LLFCSVHHFTIQSSPISDYISNLLLILQPSKYLPTFQTKKEKKRKE